MIVRTIKETDGPDGKGHVVKRPAGTEIEHPHAWMLATEEVGLAEPVDEEAKERVERANKERQDRLALLNPGKVAAKIKLPSEKAETTTKKAKS